MRKWVKSQQLVRAVNLFPLILPIPTTTEAAAAIVQIVVIRVKQRVVELILTQSCQIQRLGYYLKYRLSKRGSTKRVKAPSQSTRCIS